MNEYDSDKLTTILETQYDRIDSPESADLILVNTCSVRDKPEQKLYSLLGELRELKEIKPSLMIGVGGCVAQQEGETILKRNSAVDFVFGTHNLSLVPSLIEKRALSGRPQVAIDYRDEWEELPLGFSGEGRVSVLVSISRGCNKNCTYCIVPTTRGREVSRAASEIEREIKIAAHKGAKEVVLLGQTVNSWGADLAPRKRFTDLLEQVLQIEGIERVRFVSPHPQEVREDFIDLIATQPKICRHVHLPLQSGSDKILRAMNRNYRSSRYREIVSSLKERVPGIALTTDIIVGFPGETEADFHETLALMEEVRFQNSYSFMFSPRPGTEAAKLEDDVPEGEKLKRLQILQARQEVISRELLEQWVGKVAEVLIDGPRESAPQELQGRVSQNITVNLDAESSRDLAPGDLVSVKIGSIGRFSLRGEVVSEQPHSLSGAA